MDASSYGPMQSEAGCTTIASVRTSLAKMSLMIVRPPKSGGTASNRRTGPPGKQIEAVDALLSLKVTPAALQPARPTLAAVPPAPPGLSQRLEPMAFDQANEGDGWASP